MKSFFGNKEGLVTPRKINKQPFVKLYIGSDTTKEYKAFMTQSTISQPYRTQYDITLDGTVYILDAGKGIGTYTFMVYEGPFGCPEEIESSLAKTINNAETLEDRKITAVHYYSDGTKLQGTFTGYVSGVTVELVANENNLGLTVQVEANGQWD